jgi:hypothetical protein
MLGLTHTKFSKTSRSLAFGAKDRSPSWGSVLKT